MADMLRGMELKKKDLVSNVKVSWKQGALLGIGGDRSQTYSIVNYETTQGGSVPVYIQDGYDKPDKLVCDERLQFGISDGVFFLVYHDKSQTPYQHRFIQNDMQKRLYAGNAWLKSYTAGYADLSWASGDYLRDF